MKENSFSVIVLIFLMLLQIDHYLRPLQYLLFQNKEINQNSKDITNETCPWVDYRNYVVYITINGISSIFNTQLQKKKIIGANLSAGYWLLVNKNEIKHYMCIMSKSETRRHSREWLPFIFDYRSMCKGRLLVCFWAGVNV